ncbi:hypothetical protein C8J56DRAFT_1031471 [Mycena floridula]|nr:hypothetical protein C8J56DRAFT_1031471 [Mycena floridula]
MFPSLAFAEKNLAKWNAAREAMLCHLNKIFPILPIIQDVFAMVDPVNNGQPPHVKVMHHRSMVVMPVDEQLSVTLLTVGLFVVGFEKAWTEASEGTGKNHILEGLVRSCYHFGETDRRFGARCFFMWGSFVFVERGPKTRRSHHRQILRQPSAKFKPSKNIVISCLDMRAQLGDLGRQEAFEEAQAIAIQCCETSGCLVDVLLWKRRESHSCAVLDERLYLVAGFTTYCSRGCQRQDWPLHKRPSAPLRSLYDSPTLKWAENMVDDVEFMCEPIGCVSGEYRCSPYLVFQIMFLNTEVEVDYLVLGLEDRSFRLDTPVKKR